MNETDLRNAAIVHACIPPEYRAPGGTVRSPLHDLIPDGATPSDEVIALAERITGQTFDRTIHGSVFTTPHLQLVPRLRAMLNRWAIRQPGVIREEVPA